MRLTNSREIHLEAHECKREKGKTSYVPGHHFLGYISPNCIRENSKCIHTLHICFSLCSALFYPHCDEKKIIELLFLAQKIYSL